ncbi:MULTISPECIES: hypothetical protein [Flammeovirga]|uniref:Emp24/gp25L/p24 family protein n=2 Tax=Flammeovirga TaxID=59739 RepID=A0A3Q9FLU4_9BACT|nr:MULTISPECIES: hypothetical protein [Flammeovirga]AZQ62588.1 hypothetical protein EI427_10170 [Flammeovirga pectinis]MBB6461650.1 hypothetical protein [Flammeovirga kamogawensis]QWG07424.1 hypothetical protein KM029_00325 [Flammeovirga kamogawensis]TRX69235.1 hypothetical protein EO216_14270 [Flammeovirga kamogawensis]
MKKIFLAFSLMFALFTLNEANAQCNAELYVTKSMKELNPGFQFSKSYRIDGRNGTRRKIEYTCVLAKDTSYQITISGKDGGAQGLISTLYDAKRRRIISSFYNNRFLGTWTYKCTSTGIYYLSFTFKDSKSYCGAAVLGFKR